MTKEPRGAGELGDASDPDDLRASDDAGEPAEESAGPGEATISSLAAARARRDGPPKVEAPLAEPIQLHVPTPVRPTPVQPASPSSEPPAPTHALERPAERPAAALERPAPGAVRPTHVARRPVPVPEDRATDPVRASREVRAARAAPSGDEQPPAEERPSTQRAGVDPPRSSRRPRARVTAPEVGRSLNVEFPPKLGARRVVGALLLVALAATGAAAYVAYEDPRPLTLGGAGTLLVVTLALYAVRAGSSPTLIAIRAGQLEVTRGRSIERFDLTSRFTRIEVVGKPGRLGWKVLLGRFGKDPLVITSAVVDPKSFTAELARYRPRS